MTSPRTVHMNIFTCASFQVEDLILPDERTKAETILRFFRRLGVATVTSQDQAVELSRRIFGSKDLKSHFSIERWGG